jgi:uncharacterized membrane protein
MAEVKRTARAEHRWPAVVGLLVALALYGTLPNDFLPVVRYVVVGIGVLLLIPLLVLNPHHLNRQTRWGRLASVAQSLLLVLANQVALVQLIIELASAKHAAGPSLLITALQVWLTNVITYALIYWEMDRGGPVARTHDARKSLPAADFRFPQDEDHDAIEEVQKGSSARTDWTPKFLDYLYFSLSNSMAFSPTDVMPLSHRAKSLMGLESFAGFVILALVIARAVSLLG